MLLLSERCKPRRGYSSNHWRLRSLVPTGVRYHTSFRSGGTENPYTQEVQVRLLRHLQPMLLFKLVEIELVSVGSQTESVEDPQLEELLRARGQQAQTIRALQGVIGKKNHDLQAIRNWRPTANAIGNIYLCPGGTVWHASEMCARQRTSAELILRKPRAHCGDEQVPMPQILQDILYPNASTERG